MRPCGKQIPQGRILYESVPFAVVEAFPGGYGIRPYT